MDWNDRIYRYCERGSDPSFWAEPLNALTNLAFIIAGLLVLAEWVRAPRGERGLAELGLVGLILTIGTGSFLFHTYATRWASYADTGPIGIFMLAYLAYALRRFIGAPWVVVVLGLAAFVAALRYAGSVQCSVALTSFVDAARGPCLNGTAGYVPAFLAMALIAIALAVKGQAAWRHLALGSGVFLVSMGFRTIDWEVCELTRFLGRNLGTHFMWHLLNATLLYLLARAGIRHGMAGKGSRQLLPA